MHEHKTGYTRILKMKKNSEFLKQLQSYVPEKAKNLSLKAQIVWLLHDLIDFPKCKNCGKTLSDKNIKHALLGYNQFCSHDCANKSEFTKNKAKQTFIEKYNCENPSQNNDIKNKKIQTSLKNYGTTNPAQSQIVKNKIKTTCVQKYGTNCTLKNKNIKEKTEKTMFERYGTLHAMKNLTVQQKAKETTFKNFGVLHPMQNRDIRVKAQQKLMYDNISFDSLSELILYVFLKDKDFDFEYQPNISFEYEFEGKKHVYFPDFKIADQLIEIKGRQFFKNNGTMQNPWNHIEDELYEAKHQCMLKNNVKIILDNDLLIVEAMNYINSTYGNQFLKQFKKKIP